MPVTWNGTAAFEDAKKELAKRMLLAAVFYQTELRKRLNVSNPRPYLNSSKEGEYPRARTGFGRDNVAYEPVSVQDVVNSGFVIRLGWRQPAFYMAVLEVKKKRLGLVKTWEELLPQIKAIIGGK